MNGDYTRGREAGSARSGGKGWYWWLIGGAALFAIVHPFDRPLFDLLAGLGQRLGGDLRREWFAWQQYGQGTALIVTAVLIWSLDPRRRVRLWDLALAALASQLAAQAGKLLIGRPRPRPEFMDAESFPGPWGVYPIMREGSWKLVHAWDRSAGANADLWSMPSSHTLFACVLSVFLARLYPAAAWVFVFLAVMVGLARVVFGAHWPSDVAVGAAVGCAIGWGVVGGEQGSRAWLRITRGRGHTLRP